MSLFIDLTGLPDDADPDEFYRQLCYRQWIKLQRETARGYLEDLLDAFAARWGLSR